MKTRSFRNKLFGTVEVDETYVGGRRRGKRGRGAAGKTIVLGMVKRGGDIHVKSIKNVRGKTLKAEIRKNVEKGSRVMTDEHYGSGGGCCRKSVSV